MSAQGFEPRTHALEGRCSIQLSYAPIFYSGAGNEIRTRDFHLGKVTLYHWTIPAYTMAGITGLEPVTHWLTVNCSTNWAIFPYMAERVGFEPTVRFRITGFQDQLLKPLGHLSVTNIILLNLLNFVNSFFEKIYKL